VSNANRSGQRGQAGQGAQAASGVAALSSPGAWLAEHPGRFLAASVALTALLYVVPYGHYIGYPLMLLSTLVHELGHGVAGVLVGGHFSSFEMNWDGSGVAHVAGYSGRFARAFVSAGGLVGPAVGSAVALACARRASMAQRSLLVFGLMLAFADVWVVRTLFGVLFVGALAAICVVTSRRAPASASQLLLSFLAVQLGLSVFSRGDYLFTAVAHTASGVMPSDVANMSSALFLPYWFWGALCGAVSVAALSLGLWYFLRGAGDMVSDARRLGLRLARSAPAAGRRR
jgi:hypothetical protein